MTEHADEMNPEITEVIGNVIKIYEPDIDYITLTGVVIDICRALNEAGFAVAKVGE